MLAKELENTQNINEPFMAFVLDDVSARVTEKAVQDMGWQSSRVISGGLDKALTSIAEVGTPDLLIVDLSECEDTIAAVEQLATVCHVGVSLICLGQINDVKLYRHLMEMGVADYLLKPFDQETLRDSLERATLQEEPVLLEKPEYEGKVYSVIGCCGGSGASVIAQNFAWDFAYEKNKKTLLVDLDLYFGTQALSLDLEPGRGFHEALQSPERIDSLFLERAIVKKDKKFHLLACEAEIEQSAHFRPEAIEVLLENLQQNYEVIIIDVPRSLFLEYADILSETSETILVSNLSLAGMRDSLRLRRFIQSMKSPKDIHLIGNKVGENKERDLSPKEFEKGVDCALEGLIPFEGRTFAKADIQSGCLLSMKGKSKASQAIQDLVNSIAPDDDGVLSKASIFSRLFSNKK